MPDVMVVEDDPELRRVVCYALMDEGISCIEAANGQEALEVLCQYTAEGTPPRCMVLDIFMPGGVDGWQVLESLRSNPLWVEIPVIVLTGKATLPAEIARVECLKARHIAKSARFVDELVLAVREATQAGR